MTSLSLWLEIQIRFVSLIISEQVVSQAFDAFDWNHLIIDGLELKTISVTCNCYRTLIKCCKTNEGKWARSSHFY